MIKYKTAYNNALPKCGLDDGTSAAATLQVRLGAGPFFFKLNQYIQHHVFNLAFPPGGRFSNPTHFGNADRCTLFFNLLLPMTDKAYLKSYLSSRIPYNKKERRYSSLILALRDARLITNRNVDTGLVTFKTRAPLSPANWGGAIIYLIILELIGSCFKPVDDTISETNPIYKALRYFSNLSESEARAIESLRHSFAHSYGLTNIQMKKGKIVDSRTHHFQLTANASNARVVIERKQLWNGKYETINKRNTTQINIWQLGDLVEKVFTDLVAKNNKGKIELILVGGISELKAKYTAII